MAFPVVDDHFKYSYSCSCCLVYNCYSAFSLSDRWNYLRAHISTFMYIYLSSIYFFLFDTQLPNCLQYSDPNQFRLSHEKRSESCWFTSGLLSVLASSSISQTSVCCRHILAYVVTPLPWPNLTKVLFNKNHFFKKIPPFTSLRKQSHSYEKPLSLWFFYEVQMLYWLTAIVFHRSSDLPLQMFLFLMFRALWIAPWGICWGGVLVTTTARSLKANSEGLIV